MNDAKAAWMKTTAAANEPDRLIYIANAGLVLLHPYLPMLFDRLGLLGADGQAHIAPGAAASRACHLLQYLVDGRLDAPEPQLVLNKILCGLPTAVPVVRSIKADAADFVACDALLGAVIANWSVISNTSIDGLQETFLQREGRLRHGDNRWSLMVQRKTLDALTEQLPWDLSIIYHPVDAGTATRRMVAMIPTAGAALAPNLRISATKLDWLDVVQAAR